MRIQLSAPRSAITNVWAEAKACGLLAIPLAVAQITDSITGFVDTMMMGWLGSENIAAGALGAISFNYLLWVVTSVLSSVSPLTAQAYGAGNTKAVRQVLHQGFWLTLAMGIPMTAVLWHGGTLLQYFGQEPEAIALADQYLKAIAWGFIPAVACSLLKGFVSALSRPRVVMLIVLFGIVLNVGGNYVLMLGKFGFPALGLAGVGWSSTLAFWGMLMAMLVYLACSQNFAIYRLFTKLRFDAQVTRRVMQMGLPIGGLMAVEAGISAVGTFLAGQLGTEPLAAHQVAYQTAGVITYQVASGVSIATTVRVGQLLGKKDFQGSRFAGFVGIGLAGLCMGAFSLAFVLIPNQIIGLYLDTSLPANDEVAAIARNLLLLAALFQMLDGAQVTAAGALRGINDTKIPMLIGFGAHWCVGLPISYVLGMQLGLGVMGLWLGVAAGLAIAAVVLTWRFSVASVRMIRMSINLEQTQGASDNFQALLALKAKMLMQEAVQQRMENGLIQPEFSSMDDSSLNAI